MDIHYSNGSTVTNAVIQIWEDNHTERVGYYRAFWCASPEASTGSPVIGCCSPGGSHRTIKAVMREALRLYPGSEVYRNGRRIDGTR